MLAAKPDPEELDGVLAALPYPALFSPKLDGIRATVQNGRLYSRSLKPIPNRAMQELWGREGLEGLDGEIVVGPPTAEDCFNRSTSVVMSRDKGAEGAVFHVFDMFSERVPFYLRLNDVQDVLARDPNKRSSRVARVGHELIETPSQLAKYEVKQLGLGYEGIMRRSEAGWYKQGRSTLKEMGLIAVKRTVDAEAVILDTYEQEENTNAQTTNELGRSKRSSHKAGKVGKGTLGGFTVLMLPRCRCHGLIAHTRTKPCDHEFNIGTGKGLTAAVRAELWGRRKSLVGKLIKFRYQKVGTKSVPRQPIFLGFRDRKDM